MSIMLPDSSIRIIADTMKAKLINYDNPAPVSRNMQNTYLSGPNFYLMNITKTTLKYYNSLHGNGLLFDK
jgi:hypothetical protein